jgi:hypothetical protein
MTDNFDVNADIYEGIDIEQAAKENLEYAGVTLQRQWRENMRRAGYVNTGEGVNSITIDFQGDTVRVGSDLIQVIIGEYGRRPGSFPPHEPLADWVNEQSGMPSKGDEEFDSTVYAVRKSIAESGLPEWAFGRDAFKRTLDDIESDLQERLEREIEQATE